MNLEEYARRTQFYTGDVPQLLLDSLDRAQWKSFLDLGCGDGSLLYALDRRGYFASKTVHAVDLSPSRLELVRGINQEFVCELCDVCDTQVQEGSIDFLVSTQVIEHVPDDEEMIKEMSRILAPDGTVYLSTVFKKWYGWYFYRSNGRWALDPTHLREYTSDAQLLDIFHRHGFLVLANKKTLDGRPVLDAVLRRLGAGQRVYSNPLLKLLRRVSVPIPGYYIWEIVCRKK